MSDLFRAKELAVNSTPEGMTYQVFEKTERNSNELFESEFELN